LCLHCFDTVGWAAGYPACKKLSGGMLAWLRLGKGADFAYGPVDATATHYLLVK